MRRAAAEFKGLAESYCRLYQTSFDADPPTLDHLQMYVTIYFFSYSYSLHNDSIIINFRLQQMCSLMAQSMERVSTANLQEQGAADFIHTQGYSPYEAFK